MATTPAFPLDFEHTFLIFSGHYSFCDRKNNFRREHIVVSETVTVNSSDTELKRAAVRQLPPPPPHNISLDIIEANTPPPLRLGRDILLSSHTSVVTLQYFLWTAKLSSVFREDLMDYYQNIIPDGIQLVE